MTHTSRRGPPVPSERERPGTVDPTRLEPTATGRRPTWPRATRIVWGLVSDRFVILFAVLFAVLTVLSAGPLFFLDNFLNELPRPLLQETWFVLHLTLDEIAARFVVLPLLGGTVLYFAIRHRSWRPIIVSSAGVLGMNGLVWYMKFAFARHHPGTENPAFFSNDGGMAFPSGHAANAILFYGLALYVLTRYRSVDPRTVRRMIYGIATIAVVQTAVSVYLHFHWFTDLAAGSVVGALMLRLAIRLNQILPEGLTSNWWPWRAGDFLGPAQERSAGTAVTQQVAKPNGHEDTHPEALGKRSNGNGQPPNAGQLPDGVDAPPIGLLNTGGEDSDPDEGAGTDGLPSRAPVHCCSPWNVSMN